MTHAELLNSELERNYQLRKLILEEIFKTPSHLIVPGVEIPYTLTSHEITTVTPITESGLNTWWTQLCEETRYLHLTLKEIKGEPQTNI